MAHQREAELERDRIIRDGERIFGTRPLAVGITVLARGGFGVKVTLPTGTSAQLPALLDGVPVAYDYAAMPTQFLGMPEAPWEFSLRKARAR